MAKPTQAAQAAQKPAAQKPVAQKPASTAVAPSTAKVPALPGIDMQAESGSGFEKATKDSYAIPFLAILQSNSPQCKKSDGAYIKGAAEGMFFNTVTNEVLDGDEGVLVVPCAYTLTYVEWAPRDSGGGFRGEYDNATGAAMMRDTTKDANGRDTLPNGNHLAQTHNFYCLQLNADGSRSFAVISMTSTQIKKAKRWMTAMSQLRLIGANGQPFQPPMYSLVYRLTTMPEQNDKGSWFGWATDLERQLDVSDEDDAALYLEARKFYQSINKGEVKVQTRTDETAGSESHDNGM